MEVVPIFGEHMAMLKKHVGIRNYLTTVSTSYKICFQCAGVRFIELIDKNVLSLPANLSIVPLKLFLTVLALSVHVLISMHSKSY